ncbi:uncharacterized protein LOC123529827 [Mercenaria mercenaria]|uniref:uncharacterized protein LOC123529827 n=1 Tax=Mercenaria mercenaria TaxID=6596 RepID=UPI00234E74DE|nr:uncharacterized protein LOC123529827 [Mercenaria mercenaria]
MNFRTYFHVALIFFVFVSIATVLCRTTFQVSEYNKCPPQDSKFLTLVARSVEQCVEECMRRKSCEVVGYNRLLQLCKLHARTLSPAFVENNYILIRRGDIRGPECNCPEWSVCNAENGTCVIKECLPLPPLHNGTVYGNTNHFGATKLVDCTTGFFEISNANLKPIKCSLSGNWSFITHCQECPVPGEVFKFPLSTSHEGFQIYTEKKTQQSASDMCTAQSANLIRIKSWWQIQYIRSISTTCIDTTDTEKIKFWTDGKEDNDGNWTYSNGENVPLDEIFWNKNGAVGTCLRLMYKLHGIQCDSKMHFICERD